MFKSGGGDPLNALLALSACRFATSASGEVRIWRVLQDATTNELLVERESTVPSGSLIPASCLALLNDGQFAFAFSSCCPIACSVF